MWPGSLSQEVYSFSRRRIAESTARRQLVFLLAESFLRAHLPRVWRAMIASEFRSLTSPRRARLLYTGGAFAGGKTRDELTNTAMRSLRRYRKHDEKTWNDD